MGSIFIIQHRNIVLKWVRKVKVKRAPSAPGRILARRCVPNTPRFTTRSTITGDVILNRWFDMRTIRYVLRNCRREMCAKGVKPSSNRITSLSCRRTRNVVEQATHRAKCHIFVSYKDRSDGSLKTLFCLIVTQLYSYFIFILYNCMQGIFILLPF